MVPEYIERSNAAAHFENSKKVMWHKDDIVAEISSSAIPAADVAEARHGRWINDGEDWFCNRCNHNALCDKMTGIQVASAICPNCGAYMRGGMNE